MGLFHQNFDKPGPGVSPDAPRKRGAARFFEILGRDFSTIWMAGLLALISSLPFALLLWFAVSTHSLIPMLAAGILGGMIAAPQIVGLNDTILRSLRDEPLIRQKIDEAGMQERVIILGKKDNPYPYMRACDLYVQPSRYEGKAVTVREAQMLGKPVVITSYATSGSQLEDGVDGVIVPMDNAGCAAGIAALLRDPARMQQLSENCAKRDYTNSAEVEKIYALME